MRTTADAVVVGAGVIGSSVARALALGGRSVVVIERNGAPGMGSTSASSAIIRFHYSTLNGVATAWEAHFRWLAWGDFLDLPDDEPLARLVTTGSLCLNAPGEDPERTLALFDRVGVPYERWQPATVRERCPWLETGSFAPPKPVADEAFWDDPAGELGGYYCPDSGFVDDPSLAAANLASAARRAGAEFRFHAEVTEVLTTPDGDAPGGARVAGVRLADGTTVAAPVVVNVAGPASPKLNALAGVGGPDSDFGVHSRPLRVETHQVPAPPGYVGADGGPSLLMSDTDLGFYVKGTLSGQVSIGGTEPACDDLHWIEDADALDPHVTSDLYETQVYRAARRMPGLTVPNRPSGIAAAYDASDDWIPIYDKTSLPGWYVAIGTSGNQFKNAPIVGDYLRAIIDADAAGVDHDTEPVHVTLPTCGIDLDLSAYSRLRTPDPNSSNTVLG